jgi:hypothetical protein
MFSGLAWHACKGICWAPGGRTAVLPAARAHPRAHTTLAVAPGATATWGRRLGSYRTLGWPAPTGSRVGRGWMDRKESVKNGNERWQSRGALATLCERWAGADLTDPTWSDRRQSRCRLGQRRQAMGAGCGAAHDRGVPNGSATRAGPARSQQKRVAPGAGCQPPTGLTKLTAQTAVIAGR